MKLCNQTDGAPGREPVMTEDERKQLMLHAYRKQEEWKKLEQVRVIFSHEIKSSQCM